MHLDGWDVTVWAVSGAWVWPVHHPVPNPSQQSYLLPAMHIQTSNSHRDASTLLSARPAQETTQPNAERRNPCHIRHIQCGTYMFHIHAAIVAVVVSSAKYTCGVQSRVSTRRLRSCLGASRWLGCVLVWAVCGAHHPIPNPSQQSYLQTAMHIQWPS